MSTNRTCDVENGIVHWGGPLWYTLHLYSFNYPKNPSHATQDEARRLLTEGVQPLILGPDCRKNYSIYIASHPPSVSSRSSLVQWVVDLHNDVNRRLNKPELTCDEARNKYFYQKHPSPIVSGLTATRVSECGLQRSHAAMGSTVIVLLLVLAAFSYLNVRSRH